MARAYQTVNQQTVIIVGGDDVTDERLTYDLPETYPVPVPFVSLEAQIAEISPSPSELGILAVLLDAFEDHPTPGDDVSRTEAIFPLMEYHPTVGPDDYGLEVDVQESVPVALDDIATVITIMAEESPALIEDVSRTDAVFEVSATVPVSGDMVSVITSMVETVEPSTGAVTVEIDMTIWPNASITTTGWTTPANMLDKNTGTAATSAATSSGALGTGGTQNTTNCDLQVSLPDPALDDLTITSVVLDWQISAAQSGVPLSAGQANINYQYSLNNGSSYTTFFAQTALNGSTSSLDITSAVAGIWQRLKDFRIRGVGAVLSGTGLLPVTTTASWNFARVRILASKTYP